MGTAKNITRIDEACRILFGPMFHFTEETLKYIQESGIKKAYREVVKKCHPDKANSTGMNENELSGKFKEVNDAYNLLLETINKNSKPDDYNPCFRESKDFFYKGTVPKRCLRFGEYLYYNGIVSWNTLVKALTWQYGNRPKIGQICMENNLLSGEVIINVLKDTRANEKFGEAAVRKGFLDFKKLHYMLNIQMELSLPLGKYFTDNSILPEKQLRVLLNKHEVHNKNYMNAN